MKQWYPILFVLCLSLSAESLLAQNNSGNFSLGVRSTTSLFNHSNQSIGSGFGGQFRIQFSDRVNSQWFADYILSDIENVASRTDLHIGWSLMYYLIDTKDFSRLFSPYMIVGHCFDYTNISDYENTITEDRWSAAVQGGIGTHLNLTPRMDLSVEAQYMLHLGNEIHAHLHEGIVEIERHKGGGVEGHMLLTISLNYKLADLW